MSDFDLETRAEPVPAHAHAQLLGRWLWLLFGWSIFSLVVGLLNIDQLQASFPALYWPYQILQLLCSVAFCVILLKLAPADPRYRTAGICGLTAQLLSTVFDFLTSFSEDVLAITLLTALPCLVVGLVGTYNEFTAHATVLVGVDNELSMKWERLWKWHLGLALTSIAALVLIFLVQLSLLLILAAAIGSLVVDIIQLIYLYRTAQIFRHYSD